MISKNRVFHIIHSLHKHHLMPFIAVKASSLMFNNNLMDLSSSRNYLEKIYPDNGGSSHGNNSIDIQYDLQIVIAAYNCERTIADCLYSILSQKTNYCFVINVVDDGSTDNTGTIIDHIAEKANACLNVTHQSNKGLSGARNSGLKKINGRYLMFVDADDTLPEGAIESLLNQAYKYDGDIVEGGYNVFTDGGKVTSTFRHSFSNQVDPFNSLYGYPWGKLYKADLFKNIIFPEGYWFEDTVAMYRIWPNAKRVVTIENSIYNYRNNPYGITAASNRSPKVLDTLWITQKLLNECGMINEQIYDFTLSQIIMNTQRLIHLSDAANKANFVVSRYLINHYFPEYKTNSKGHLNVQHALKSGDYKEFLNCVYEK